MRFDGPTNGFFLFILTVVTVAINENWLALDFLPHRCDAYRSFFNLAKLTNNLADAGKRFLPAPARIRPSQHKDTIR